MKPLDFINKWAKTGDPLSPLTLSRIERFNLSNPTINFLTIAGLPVYAKPNLSFAGDTDDLFDGINKLTEQYNLYDKKSEFEKYIVIGSCRDGDAIAINTEQEDRIVELDHEDFFSEIYFNNSIETLADFLILYRDFQAEILKDKNSEDNFQFFNFSDEQFDNLKSKMISFDSKSVTERGFWKEELEILLSIRQEYFERK